MYSDSGTAWETGYASAHDKTIYQVLCGGENTEYSLMMINSADKILMLDDLRRHIIPARSEILNKINQK